MKLIKIIDEFNNECELVLDQICGVGEYNHETKMLVKSFVLVGNTPIFSNEFKEDIVAKMRDAYEHEQMELEEHLASRRKEEREERKRAVAEIVECVVSVEVGAPPIGFALAFGISCLIGLYLSALVKVDGDENLIEIALNRVISISLCWLFMFISQLYI